MPLVFRSLWIIFQSAFCAALVAFCAASNLRAQFHFDRLTTDHGLPQNSVLSVVQTRDGYLWLSTSDGLARFDGVRFTVFNKANTGGMLSNRFTRLYEAADGKLWAGTEDGGLVGIHNGAFHSLTTADGLSSNQISWIYGAAGAEKMLIETSGGLRWFDGANFTEVAEQKKFDKPKVYLAPSGSLWLIGQTKLQRTGAGGETEEFDLPAPLKFSASVSPLEDSGGALWLATEEGIARHSGGALSVFDRAEGIAPEAFGKIRAMLETKSGELWFAAPGTLFKFADGRFEEVEGVPTVEIVALAEDREGTIWAGTAADGLLKISRQFIRPVEGLSFKNIYPILQTRAGEIFVGGQPGLARQRDGVFADLPLVREFSGDLEKERLALAGAGAGKVDVTALAETSDGAVWIGALNGLARLSGDTLVDFSPLITFRDEQGFVKRGAVWTITEDGAGALWFGTEHGLFRYAGGQIKRFSAADGLPDKNVRIVFARRDGRILIGTQSGLAKFDPARERFENLGLANKQVRAIKEDEESTVWIGTYDGGVYRLLDNTLTNFSTADGLFSNGAFQILEDEAGWFWISSNQGIYRVRRDDLNMLADGKTTRVNSIAYGKLDGMLNAECNGGRQPGGIKLRDGTLWFPTQTGIAVIDPRRAPLNEIAPPVVIEKISIDNRQVPLNAQSGIELQPGQANLEIAYTGLSFVKPDQVRFRYRLENLSDDWTETGARRTAYFSYLPPGEYTFRVVAANSDGVWNTHGASVKIKILPPFYRTWWFSMAAVALVCMLVYVIYQNRVRRVEKARFAQEEFSRQLLESQERERQRIAAELHDSIGQSLLIIKNRAFLALSDLTESENVREQLEELSESAGGAIEECREIAYNLRPYQIERFGLAKTLEAMFRRITDVAAIETSVRIVPLDDLFDSEVQTNIYRIVQESVNNIIKHSGASHARLEIKRTASAVEILIADNGRGFNLSAPNPNGCGGFGLIGIAERVRLLGGIYEIQANRGTKIRIVLPFKNNE